MKKSPYLIAVGILVLALTGCGRSPVPQPVPDMTTVPASEASIPATIPPDGNPDDVTCKGSYTGQPGTAIAAQIGTSELTNEVLSAYYWAQAAAYRQSGETPAPDWNQPLDTQVCDIDSSVATWQQFFLRRALNTWHTAQALILRGETEGLPREEAYQPNEEAHQECLADIPATRYLYRYQKAFQPNTMHQAYLDSIPETLEVLAAEKGYENAAGLAQKAFGVSLDTLEAVMEAYNRGYMYATNLFYYLELPEEETGSAVPAGEAYVDMRHILLIPQGDDVTVAPDGTVTCPEEQWEACEAKAQALLSDWAKSRNNPSEGTFAELAFHQSQDPDSAPDGGAYHQIRKGQLTGVLDSWCFDEARQPGDTAILRSPCGVHILYFSRKCPIAQAQAEADAMASLQANVLAQSRALYLMKVNYSAIVLSEGESTVSFSDLLYPDVAHERFPELPLYLQQDYPKTSYGAYPIRTNGCGITSFAMIASYFTDDELTPPEMCARYGKYSFLHGTDGIMFLKEPQALGFYPRERTYRPDAAKAALEEGHIVVCVQNPGYWTRGGHYIVLEKIFDDDTVQVRDSNLYNYKRIPAHKEDRHAWKNIIAAVNGFWVFEDKVTAIPACSRCGTSGDKLLLQEDYLCPKCAQALLRRNTYLSACGD